MFFTALCYKYTKAHYVPLCYDNVKFEQQQEERHENKIFMQVDEQQRVKTLLPHRKCSHVLQFFNCLTIIQHRYSWFKTRP